MIRFMTSVMLEFDLNQNKIKNLDSTKINTNDKDESLKNSLFEIIIILTHGFNQRENL